MCANRSARNCASYARPLRRSGARAIKRKKGTSCRSLPEDRPSPMLMNLPVNQIVQGHVPDILSTLPSESIDMVITSPPYWALRDYETTDQIWGATRLCKHDWSKGSVCVHCSAWRGQLGLEPTFEFYIRHLCDIFDQVRRILKPEGSCWVNLGDTYSG